MRPFVDEGGVNELEMTVMLRISYEVIACVKGIKIVEKNMERSLS